MQFTKMHGAGNDYIYVDCFQQPVPADPAQLAIVISDRHTGIGGDGLILICPSDLADVRMRMFNADGSEAEMCGNGIRCLCKYVYEHQLVVKDELHIETGAGVLTARLNANNGRVDSVRVNMGPPILTAADIPTTLPGDPPLCVPVVIEGRQFVVTCVSMGNPHCVTFVDELSDTLVHKFGPLLERNPVFPQRANIEFVRVLSPSEIVMRVWERGSGETQACGTGACAVVVAGVLAGKTQRTLTAQLPGGKLQLEWSEAGDVFLTGGAVEVFQGEWCGSLS